MLKKLIIFCSRIGTTKDTIVKCMMLVHPQDCEQIKSKNLNHILLLNFFLLSTASQTDSSKALFTSQGTKSFCRETKLLLFCMHQGLITILMRCIIYLVCWRQGRHLLHKRYRWQSVRSMCTSKLEAL